MSEYVSPFVNVIGKTVVFYVSNIPLYPEQFDAYQEFLTKLPPRPDCGVTIKKWSDIYPSVPYPGIMIGMRDMTVAQSTEVLVPLADFRAGGVPWEKLNPIRCA